MEQPGHRKKRVSWVDCLFAKPLGLGKRAWRGAEYIANSFVVANSNLSICETDSFVVYVSFIDQKYFRFQYPWTPDQGWHWSLEMHLVSPQMDNTLVTRVYLHPHFLQALELPATPSPIQILCSFFRLTPGHAWVNIQLSYHFLPEASLALFSSLFTLSRFQIPSIC